MTKPLLPVAIIASIAGLAFSNAILISLATLLLVWYGATDFRTKMLNTHQANLIGETIKFGKVAVPIADCTLEKPTYRLVFPEVSQLLT